MGQMGGTSEIIVEETEAGIEPAFLLQPSSLAVCLVSGGMDSCVTSAMAREENDELAFLHVTYGQRTAAREQQAFLELADHFGVVRRMVASIEYLTKIGGSSLTDLHIPVAAADLSSREIPTSYVPFRNSHLLSIATSWAEVMGARRIYIGAVAEDSSGYPDCRRAVAAESRPQELRDLQEDILISVTRFFRDPEVFDALKQELFPRLFEKRTPQHEPAAADLVEKVLAPAE